MGIAEIIMVMLANISLLQQPQIQEVTLPSDVKEEVVKPLNENETQDLFNEVQENSCSHGSCSLAAHR